jgi:hypothetical protein
VFPVDDRYATVRVFTKTVELSRKLEELLHFFVGILVAGDVLCQLQLLSVWFREVMLLSSVYNVMGKICLDETTRGVWTFKESNQLCFEIVPVLFVVAPSV